MMATMSTIESFPTNDDVFDAEGDDDSDGGQEDDVPQLNNDIANSVEDKTTVKDDIFDDEGSPQVPQTNESSDESEKENEDEVPHSSKQKHARFIQETSPKPRKLKKAAIQSIHSECQRMLRDSRLKLPYYTPAVKPITHFLKRVPIGTLPAKKPESSQDSNKTETDTSSQPAELNVIKGKESKGVTTPKLSDANDPFFFDETPTDKLPTKGVQKLMQRFAKHTKTPKEIIKKESIVILDNEKARQQQPLKKTDKPVPGGRLQALKEQLEVKMKRQREELRKIHESQRKLDNEEISDEEEEAEITDESDYELDQWNADDEAKQEEEDNDEPAQNDFIDAEADEDDGDSNAVEDNSGSDGDISDEGLSDNDDDNSGFSDKDKTKRQKHIKHKRSNGIKLATEQKTEDTFNVNSNSQSISEDSQGNNTEDTDNRQSLCLRLDSVDDDYESPEEFTKTKSFKSPESSLSLQLASDLTSNSSIIEPGQGEGRRNFSRQESDSEVSSMLPPIAKRSSNKENTQTRPKKKVHTIALW